MIYCFGDSWGEGAELKENENPFVYHLAKDLGEKFINFSSQGNSYSSFPPNSVVKELLIFKKLSTLINDLNL